MAADEEIARLHGHGPCTWCGRELRPFQRPAPPTPEEAEIVAMNAMGMSWPSPCTRCGRKLETGQASDPDRDPTAKGPRSVDDLRVTFCKVCSTPIADPATRGRPPSYCSPACSAEARRMRRRKAAGR